MINVRRFWILLAGLALGSLMVRHWLKPQPADNNVLLYDNDCGFCQQSMQRLKKLGVQAQLKPSQDHQALLLEAGLTTAESQRYLIWLSRSHPEQPWQVKRGAAAVNAALAHCYGPWRWPLLMLSGLYNVPGIQQVENIVYRWIANNRHRFGSATCALTTPNSLNPC